MSKSIRNQIIDGTITRREIVEIINNRERELADLENQLQEANDKIESAKDVRDILLNTIDKHKSELSQLRQERDYHKSLAELLPVNKIIAERDTLRAEVERLRKATYDIFNAAGNPCVEIREGDDGLLATTKLVIHWLKESINNKSRVQELAGVIKSAFYAGDPQTAYEILDNATRALGGKE